MHRILRLTVVCGAGALAACGSLGSGVSPMAQAPAQPGTAQTAALEPAPVQAAPRPRRAAPAAAGAEAEATANVIGRDSQPVAFNSPEWKEREKRRDEELNRKINSICRGC